MTNKIFIKGLRLYAYHGVLEQEQKVGAYFTIDIELTTDFSNAIKTDSLSGTVSYADLYELVKKEMAIPSKLLEHVVGRIADSVFSSFSNITEIDITLTKENPPMGADCSGAGVRAVFGKS